MKIVNLLLSAAMASTMLFQGAAFDAQAAEGVSAEVSDDGAVIGNGYLTRSFQIEDGHLRTENCITGASTARLSHRRDPQIL